MDVLMDPIVKYGFAGFAAILLAILIWMIRHLLAANRREAEVIAANTDALVRLTDTLRKVVEMEVEIRDRLRFQDSGAGGRRLHFGPPDLGGSGMQDARPSGGGFEP